jgi:hypothetical protein
MYRLNNYRTAFSQEKSSFITFNDSQIRKMERSDLFDKRGSSEVYLMAFERIE